MKKQKVKRSSSSKGPWWMPGATLKLTNYIKSEVMLLTVKKQIEDTIEVKTPAYYKGVNECSFINESGQLVVVRQTMIFVWDSSYGYIYRDEVEKIIRECTPCEKADFDKVYSETKFNMDIAAGAVEF